MKLQKLLIATLLAGAAVYNAEAKITLPAILSDNMVLQQQSDVQLRGTATPGKQVVIQPSWSKEKIKIKADESGKWNTTLPTPSAGGPYEIFLSDGDPLTLKNILIGEVWLCSGQSNMEMPMKGFRSQPTEGSREILISADKSTPIRAFTVKRKISRTPETDCEGSWVENTPADVAETSATAYFFARYLQQTLNVPVGIIVSCWSGTNIEPWMSVEELQNFPQISLSHLQGTDEIKDAWHGAVLYNGMMMPLKDYRIKGMIWYQGESNRNNAALYQQLLPAFVRGMRNTWKQGDFPFYYTQIAPYKYEGADSLSGAYLREAQLNAMSLIPNSGMAVTLDIGELNGIHPRKKRQVGERLALWALAKDYNKNDFTYQGPVYKEMTIENGKAVIKFDAIPNGVAPYATPLDYFEIAGADRVFHPANAMLNYQTGNVEVWTDSVPTPVAVRYAFKNFTGASVFDTFGLPASSFRTDNW